MGKSAVGIFLTSFCFSSSIGIGCARLSHVRDGERPDASEIPSERSPSLPCIKYYSIRASHFMFKLELCGCTGLRYEVPLIYETRRPTKLTRMCEKGEH